MNQKRETHSEQVLRAIIDLDAHDKRPTRQAIAAITHLAIPRISESINTLFDAGKIKRLYDGVWIPVDTTPDRVISASPMPQGRLKIELGDEIITLTPRESFELAKLVGGILLAFKLA